MGAITSNRKRGEEYSSSNRSHPYPNSPDFQVSKRPRFSSMQQSLDRPALSSKNTSSRIARYPEGALRLRREVHAPCRTLKFGFASCSGRDSKLTGKKEFEDVRGDVLSYHYDKAKCCAFDSFRYLKKDKEVIVVDEEAEKEAISEDSSIEEVEIVEELDAKAVGRGVSDLTNENFKVDTAGRMLDSLSVNQDVEVLSLNAYKKLLENAERRMPKLKALGFQIELNEKLWTSFQSLRLAKKPVEEEPHEPFVPLTKTEEAEVGRAFWGNRRKVLVSHKNSNIEITGELLQCLRPGAWLNDEVINVYLELLKEREKREPQKFLKCHFFNTFFYKKLIGGKGGYDYKSVRRWTSQRKLGYGLIECDKIFVPIHKEIHWCLAVINKKDEKFQYLDSLRGRDSQVLKVLARYFVDEVKDKSGKDINVSSWKQEFVEDLPEQENGFDCGMFMIKYADFYGRGLGLCFNQDHMPYFRLRTAKEILRLRAD